MKTKKTVLYFSILVIAIVILLNILSDRFFLRLDLTGDHRYTLSKATKDILRQLDEPVTITAYFSEDMPPEIARARRDFKEMLIEYKNVSKGKVVYEFIDPNKSPENEQKAMEAGIQPVIINTRDKDQSVQKKAYLGAVIQKGEKNDVQPFIQPGAAMEYDLSSGIKKLCVQNKPRIAFIVGHGEPTLDAYAQVMNSLEVLYAPVPVMLNDTSYNLGDFQTAVLVAPKDSIPPQHLVWLDRFLNEGKNLVVAINRVEGDMSAAMGKEVNTGLESWLEKWGIRVESNFIIDASCAPVMVTQQQGMYTISTNINFPYIPVINKFPDHPITKGLEAVVLPFASTITFTGDSTWNFTPIVESSSKSGTRPVPTYFDIRKQWTGEDFPLSNLVAGAVLQKKTPGKESPRIVVFSDGDFPVNGTGQEQHQIQPDNASLLVNSIDWLSDDTGLIALRTKGIMSRPLDQIDDSKKTLLKFLNFLLPILLIIGFGIYRIQHNRVLRIKRMEDSYV
jgi:gliding-associated putative ABC transporter substrate-binding component GldG